MKSIFASLGQVVLFLLFVGVFFVGSFASLLHVNVLHAHWFLSHPTATTVRYFDPNGLLFATLLFAIVFALEAAAKRLRTAGLWTTIAFVAALLVGFAMRFGFATHDLY